MLLALWCSFLLLQQFKDESAVLTLMSAAAAAEEISFIMVNLEMAKNIHWESKPRSKFGIGIAEFFFFSNIIFNGLVSVSQLIQNSS